MNDATKKATLLNYVGHKTQRTYNNFAGPVETYEQALEVLESLFGNRSTLTATRFKFRKRMQKRNETFQEYYNSLKEKITECEYGVLEHDVMCDQLVVGVFDSNLQEKFLATQKLSLKKTIRIALAHELTLNQINNTGRSYKYDNNYMNNDRYVENKNFINNESKKCFRCGSFKHLANFKECPALTKECSKCGKIGHFQACCKTKNEKVNTMGVKRNNKFLYKEIEIEGVNVDFLYDTGASCSLINKHDLGKCDSIRFKKSKRSLASYNRTIKTIGMKSFFVKCDDRKLIHNFYIVNEGKSIMGLDLIKRLNPCPLVNHIDEPINIKIKNLITDFEKKAFSVE